MPGPVSLFEIRYTIALHTFYYYFTMSDTFVTAGQVMRERNERCVAWVRLMAKFQRDLDLGINHSMVNEFIALDLSFVGFLAMQNDFIETYLIGSSLGSWSNAQLAILHVLCMYLQKKHLIHPETPMTHAESIAAINSIDLVDFRRNFTGSYDWLLESEVGRYGVTVGKYYGDMLVLIQVHGFITLEDIVRCRRELRRGIYRGVCHGTQTDFALLAEFSLAHPELKTSEFTWSDVVAWGLNSEIITGLFSAEPQLNIDD